MSRLNGPLRGEQKSWPARWRSKTGSRYRYGSLIVLKDCGHSVIRTGDPSVLIVCDSCGGRPTPFSDYPGLEFGDGGKWWGVEDVDAGVLA